MDVRQPYNYYPSWTNGFIVIRDLICSLWGSFLAGQPDCISLGGPWSRNSSLGFRTVFELKSREPIAMSTNVVTMTSMWPTSIVDVVVLVVVVVILAHLFSPFLLGWKFSKKSAFEIGSWFVTRFSLGLKKKRKKNRIDFSPSFVSTSDYSCELIDKRRPSARRPSVGPSHRSCRIIDGVRFDTSRAPISSGLWVTFGSLQWKSSDQHCSKNGSNHDS